MNYSLLKCHTSSSEMPHLSSLNATLRRSKCHTSSPQMPHFVTQNARHLNCKCEAFQEQTCGISGANAMLLNFPTYETKTGGARRVRVRMTSPFTVGVVASASSTANSGRTGRSTSCTSAS